MKTLRIEMGKLGLFSWKTRFTTFLSIIGITWLIIEPFGAFGGASILEELNYLGYLGLLVFSILITILIEVINNRVRMGDITFINFTIFMQETGRRYHVEAPKDMILNQFINKFLEEVHPFEETNRFVAYSYMYDWNLLVKRKGEYRELLSNKTIMESGIKKNDLCKFTVSRRDDWYDGC